MVFNTQSRREIRHGIMAVTVGLTFMGCNQAGAKDKNISSKTEIQKVTRDQCIALATKNAKIACMKTLQTQRASEIAVLDEGLVNDASEIEVIETNIHTEYNANEDRRKRVDVLKTENEALRKVIALQEKPRQ